MLFGAAHDLLLAGVEHPLARFYPTLAEDPDPGDPFPAFRDFCLAHREAIARTIASHRVQTNEVGRAALLAPAYARALEKAAGRPLAVFEVGAAAGLNLLWDRYAIDYGPDLLWGDPAAPVRMRCLVRGPRAPRLPPPPPVAIAARTGIDLHPVDIRDPAAARWLRALVWPDQRERHRLLDRALAFAREVGPPRVIEGDALALLPDLLRTAPAGALPCVLHSFATYQLPAEARERLAQIARDAGAVRIAVEWIGTPATTIEVDGEVLATADPHGIWIEPV